MKRLMMCILVASVATCLAMGCNTDSKPAEKPTTTAEKPADKTAKKPAEKPADKAAKKPAEKPASAPAAKKAEGPEKDGKGGLLVKSELYKVKFTVPEGWTVDKSPTGISANSPDKKVLMIVAGSSSQDLAEAALNDLKQNLSFKDIKIQKQGTTTVNGLIGLRGEGDATLIHEDDNNREEAIHFVGFTSKVDAKAITVLLFTSKETYEKHMDLVEGVLTTMDKL